MTAIKHNCKKGQPEGYLHWHVWAKEKSRTYKQSKCPVCGLFTIWTKK